jgi:hypothetical protein
MIDPLRQAAEAVARKIVDDLIPGDNKNAGDLDLTVNYLVAFAKAQRAAEVKAIIKQAHAGSLSTLGFIAFTYWLDARAKEWET